jgi:hypothetical protein
MKKLKRKRTFIHLLWMIVFCIFALALCSLMSPFFDEDKAIVFKFVVTILSGLILVPLYIEREKTTNTIDQLNTWVNIYKEYFNLTLDINSIKVPRKRSWAKHLILVSKDLLIQKAFDKISDKMGIYELSFNLDSYVKQNCRTTKETYAIWVGDFSEASDEEIDMLKNKATIAKGLTVLEMIFFEAKLFFEKDDSLKTQEIILCPGSRSDHGLLPGVYWYRAGLEIGFYNKDSANNVFYVMKVLAF